jgi:hypothetical protein
MPTVNSVLRKNFGFMHQASRRAIRQLRSIANIGLENEARTLLKGLPQSPIVVPEDMGFLKFNVEEIGLTKSFTKLCELAELWKRDKTRNGGDKPFLIDLFRSEDFLDFPEIFEVAMNPVLYSAASTYLRQVPRLVSLMCWLSPPNNTAIRSQLYHYDHKDTRQAKIFLNLNDVVADSGPLHFLAVPDSEVVNSKIGYSQSRYTDEEVYSAVPKEVTRAAIGRKGTGFFVDTARCLHYGSRGNTRERLVLMINYARANRVERGSDEGALASVRQAIIQKYFARDQARSFSLQ